MGSMNIYNGTNKASITYSGTSDVSVDATNLSGLTGNVQTQLGTKANTADLKEIGVGQTWQNVTASRALGVTYTNSTGKPIMVVLTGTNYSYGAFYVGVDGIQRMMKQGSGPTNVQASLTIIVPNGSVYVVSAANSSITSWQELR